MAKFIALYRASQTAAEQMANTTPEQMQAGMALWDAWVKKAGDAVVDLGTPLTESRTIPPGAGDGRGGQIGGYSILEGQSADAIAALLADHPHFHSPGASIEVLELMSMSGSQGS